MTYGNVCCPLDRHIHVTKDGSTELVTSLVRKDGWILSVRQASVWVDVSDEMLDVVLEVLDDGGIGVELLDQGVDLG